MSKAPLMLLPSLPLPPPLMDCIFPSLSLSLKPLPSSSQPALSKDPLTHVSLTSTCVSSTHSKSLLEELNHFNFHGDALQRIPYHFTELPFLFFNFVPFLASGSLPCPACYRNLKIQLHYVGIIKQNHETGVW